MPPRETAGNCVQAEGNCPDWTLAKAQHLRPGEGACHRASPAARGAAPAQSSTSEQGSPLTGLMATWHHHWQ